MRIRYDPEVDALRLFFRETTVSVQELADGQLVSLEILDAGKQFGEPSVLREVNLEGVGPTAPLALTGT